MILLSTKLLRSFTLIELLMVISIITIVAGITIPSFTGYMTNQTIKNAQDQFKNDLRSVENMALTGSKYDTSVTCGATTCPARYWVVKWLPSGSSYSTYLLYDIGTAFESTCNSLPGVYTKQFSYTLPVGITFKGTTGCNECLFFNMSDGNTRYSSHNGASACTNNNAESIKIVLQNASGTSSPVSWNRNGMVGN